MVNILTDSLPEAVRVNGVETKINTDFKTCLRVIMAWEDEDLTVFEKQSLMLALLYPEPVSDLSGACEVAVRFLNGGKAAGSEDAPERPRLFSWAKDANFIYAAFRQTHGIDLETENMHWWKFMALFMDLGADTYFCHLTNLRERVKTGKATKEERRAAREMGEAFDVPDIDDRSVEEREREDEFLRLVGAKA